MSRAQVKEHPVTTHAVVRYPKRIHGFQLTTQYPFASDDHRAEIGCELLRMTVDECRDRMCPPRFHAVIAMGFTFYIRAGDRSLRIRDGVVKACIELNVNPRKLCQRATRGLCNGPLHEWGRANCTAGCCTIALCRSQGRRQGGAVVSDGTHRG